MNIKLEEIPTEYHFLFGNDMHNTDSMSEKLRVEKVSGISFNKCEKCGYDLTKPSSYRYQGASYKTPYKGFVKYYHYQNKQILCDKCIDELIGHPWM